MPWSGNKTGTFRCYYRSKDHLLLVGVLICSLWNIFVFFLFLLGNFCASKCLFEHKRFHFCRFSSFSAHICVISRFSPKILLFLLKNSLIHKISPGWSGSRKARVYVFFCSAGNTWFAGPSPPLINIPSPWNGGYKEGNTGEGENIAEHIYSRKKRKNNSKFSVQTLPPTEQYVNQSSPVALQGNQHKLHCFFSG